MSKPAHMTAAEAEVAQTVAAAFGPIVRAMLEGAHVPSARGGVVMAEAVALQLAGYGWTAGHLEHVDPQKAMKDVLTRACAILAETGPVADRRMMYR